MNFDVYKSYRLGLDLLVCMPHGGHFDTLIMLVLNACLHKYFLFMSWFFSSAVYIPDVLLRYILKNVKLRSPIR